MNNVFGKSLRSYLENNSIKESELADELGYDATYISKWINGSKLPSPRNADRLIRQMADFFVKRIQGSGEAADGDALWHSQFTELKSAYDRDSRYLTFQGYNNHHMSFLDNRQGLVSLTRDALMQALDSDDSCISITTTVDLFHLYGKEFKRLMQELHDAGVKRVEIKLALDPDVLIREHSFYAGNILGTIGSLDYIELSIVCKMPEQPQILLINELLCLQVLWNTSRELAAVFSMESKIVKYFQTMFEQIYEGAEKLLDPAEPERLRRTNVQIDSYSDHRQWLFFNEPPALLFPGAVMDTFIEHTEDESYASYLLKLKNAFEKHTCKSQIDLVIFSSMLNRYLSDGKVSIGNVDHQLSEEQTHSHIQYLSRIMTENPDFKVYLIRDTVVLSEEVRKSPSVFLDTHSLYIENSKKNPNDNFHISMDQKIREGFQRFFENILAQPYCVRLTAEDILRYL